VWGVASTSPAAARGWPANAGFYSRSGRKWGETNSTWGPSYYVAFGTEQPFEKGPKLSPCGDICLLSRAQRGTKGAREAAATKAAATSRDVHPFVKGFQLPTDQSSSFVRLCNYVWRRPMQRRFGFFAYLFWIHTTAMLMLIIHRSFCEELILLT